jgi:hypothetical protein
VKLEAVMAKLTEIRVRMKKITESPLLIVQKMDAIKTFISPTLDFAMLNGDIGEKQLIIIDKHTSSLINEAMNLKRLRREEVRVIIVIVSLMGGIHGLDGDVATNCTWTSERDGRRR